MNSPFKSNISAARPYPPEKRQAGFNHTSTIFQYPVDRLMVENISTIQTQYFSRRLYFNHISTLFQYQISAIIFRPLGHTSQAGWQVSTIFQLYFNIKFSNKIKKAENIFFSKDNF